MPKVKLYEIAHSRAGDKGDAVNLSLIPYNEGHYDILKTQITAAAVKEHFGSIAAVAVARYDMDSLKALNFVLYGARPGGVTATLELDAHGKSLSWALLEMTVELQ